MGYYIYKHLNSDLEVIYVGQTIDMENRQKQHKLNSAWKNEIFKIEYAEVTDSLLMDIYERLYIDRYRTKYNIKDKDCEYSRFFKNMEELEFKEYVVNTRIEKVKIDKLKNKYWDKNYGIIMSILKTIKEDYEKIGGNFDNETNKLTVFGRENSNSFCKIKTKKYIEAVNFLTHPNDKGNYIYDLNKNYYGWCGDENGDKIWEFVEENFY